MPSYIPIINEDVEKLIFDFENVYQSSNGKINMTLRGDKCDIVYEENVADSPSKKTGSFNYYSSPFFSLYFKEIQEPCVINDEKFSITIKTKEIIARSGYDNILVRYAVGIRPIMLNGKISKLSDKQNLDKRVMEEIEKIFKNGGDIDDLSSIPEDRLDISHRTKPN